MKKTKDNRYIFVSLKFIDYWANLIVILSDKISPMTEINHLISQVKLNCNISDAKYWGNYTVCTLLLWLRELYRFENGIKPWEDVEKKLILDWISDRERLWSELEDRDFVSIEIEEIQHVPFNTETINAILLPQGIFYGAGYGQKMKPSFFLAGLHKKYTVQGYSVYIAGKEYVRDLAFYPAMLQDKRIIARRDITLHLLWDKFNEMRLNRYKGSFAFAFSSYGVLPDEEPSEALNIKLMDIADSEIESYIYHEVGEIVEGERLGEQWKDFLFSISGSRTELLARGIKDLLADTSEKGMLSHMIELRTTGSLAFYVASLRGYRKLLFKGISEAFEKFIETGDWDVIERARKDCYKIVTHYAETMLDLYRTMPERTRLIEHIEREFSRFF